MLDFTINIVINQLIDVVDKALINPDNFIYWTSDLEKFEVIKSKPGETGGIAHLHYLENNKKYIKKEIYIYCEPRKKYISLITGNKIITKVSTCLQSLNNKTEFCFHWVGNSERFIQKLFLLFFRKKIIKQLKKDLEVFKRLVETRGSNFKKSQKKDKCYTPKTGLFYATENKENLHNKRQNAI